MVLSIIGNHSKPKFEPKAASLSAAENELNATIFETGYYIGISHGTIHDEWLTEIKSKIAQGKYNEVLKMIQNDLQEDDAGDYYKEKL